MTVRSWRPRLALEGLAKFGQVREGRGRKPVLSAVKVEEIVRLDMHEKPSGQRIGAVVQWPKRSGSVLPRCSGSGPGVASSRTW